jgi:hypothetical protein
MVTGEAMSLVQTEITLKNAGESHGKKKKKWINNIY